MNFECYFEFLSVQYDESIHAPEKLNRFVLFANMNIEGKVLVSLQKKLKLIFAQNMFFIDKKS
jgi:hypothetical protein